MIGLLATGVAYVVLYTAYLPLLYFILRRRIGFRWSGRVVGQSIALLLTAIIVSGIAQISETAASIAGLIFTLSFGFYALDQLAKMANLEGRLGILVSMSRRLNLFRKFR